MHDGRHALYGIHSYIHMCCMELHGAGEAQRERGGGEGAERTILDVKGQCWGVIMKQAALVPHI